MLRSRSGGETKYLKTEIPCPIQAHLAVWEFQAHSHMDDYDLYEHPPHGLNATTWIMG